MLAKKTSKNQITLPKAIVKAFPDTDYFDVQLKDNQILLQPVKILPAELTLEGIRKKLKLLGVTEGDVEGAIQWARRKRK
jgi:hypothetical protein